jgi:hypothetical protein
MIDDHEDGSNTVIAPMMISWKLRLSNSDRRLYPFWGVTSAPHVSTGELKPLVFLDIPRASREMRHGCILYSMLLFNRAILRAAERCIPSI